MRLLKISDEVYEYYKANVRGNENISKDQAARKFTRNVKCAKEVQLRDKFARFKGKKLYHYGNLDIIVRWGKVIHIKNIKGGKRKGNWHKDIEKYNRLTKELGIEDWKSKKELHTFIKK